MKAIITGVFLSVSSYHSEKKQCDIPQLVLYDGEKDNVTVDNVPPELGKNLKFGDSVELPVKIFAGQYGLRVSYDSPTAPAVSK